MKNKFIKALSCLSLLAALLALTPVQAQTNLKKARFENMTDEEFKVRAEQKYARDLAEQEAIENATDDEEELGQLKVTESSLLSLSTPGEQDDNAMFPTSHTGAWHKAIGVSATGNHVFLEDGSGWDVYIKDRHKTMDWYGDDRILLTKATWSVFYSCYEYVLINTRTHVRVYVGLQEKPDFFNESTLWVKKIDRLKSRITLSDDTVWTYSPNVLDKWMEGQKVLIGVREPSFFHYHHNFLLNEDAGDFVNAECLY